MWVFGSSRYVCFFLFLVVFCWVKFGRNVTQKEDPGTHIRLIYMKFKTNEIVRNLSVFWDRKLVIQAVLSVPGEVWVWKPWKTKFSQTMWVWRVHSRESLRSIWLEDFTLIAHCSLRQEEFFWWSLTDLQVFVCFIFVLRKRRMEKNAP